VKKSNIQEVIFALGHKNILSTHRTTLEFTKDKNITKNGNCIVAVAADKSVTDLSEEFKKRLKKNNSNLTIIIEANGFSDKVTAKGCPDLVLTNIKDIVIRKSEYICDRTLAIKANKAAYDLSTDLVNKLKNPKEKIKITLIID